MIILVEGRIQDFYDMLFNMHSIGDMKMHLIISDVEYGIVHFEALICGENKLNTGNV